MNDYIWDWSIIWNAREAFLMGLVKTFELTAISILLGTLLGSGIGVILSSESDELKELKLILSVVVDIFRSLPILILLLLFNYWLPSIIGINSAFWLASLAISLNLAAFIADVFRASIQGVPKPFINAGLALGMNSNMVLKRITLPEAFRQVLPTIALLYIDVLKMSSFASVIAVKDITYMATLVSSQKYRYLEVFAFLAVTYIIIILPFSYGVRRLEKSKWFLRRT